MIIKNKDNKYIQIIMVKTSILHKNKILEAGKM